MDPNTLRSSYLQFFENQGHRVVDSSPVIPQGDDTLLFTNAGMNQFKDVLLGNEKRDYVRAASVQKCVRAGGKHNDLDEVGRDGRHLTFFEMLGNWSFGEYYKRKAILWAWQYITEVLKLDLERLYVTVYKDDDTAWDIWTKEVGFPLERIARQGDIDQGDEENFWSMGPTGPCGPCTEIHYDLKPGTGDVTFAQNQYDEDRIVEFWNLVFMEFNRDDEGTLTPLPLQSVDTGMGFDRMAMILAGTQNVFHTELFTPIFETTCSLLGRTSPREDLTTFYAQDEFPDFAIIADHIRTVTFALTDGAKFSNEGRGSVLRSILRRGVRHGRKLGFEAPFMHEIARVVAKEYGDTYPELRLMGDRVSQLIKLEEQSFFTRIDSGLKLFEQAVTITKEQGSNTIPAQMVFDLHATHGFPVDMTNIMAQDIGLKVDLQGYDKLWKEHQDISKGKDMYAGAAGAGDWITVNEGTTNTFVGYDSLESPVILRRWRMLDEQKQEVEVLLDQTPFYAESGGQIGDQGVIESTTGDLQIEVTDTQKTPIGIVHRGLLKQGSLDSAGPLQARVTAQLRTRTIANHTATHLLHAALRDIVSDEIFQSGSSVTPEKLRFDFSLGRPVTPDELRAIEDRVNAQIRQGHQVKRHVDIDRDTAINDLGAMAIFGEKYGDKVRVIEIPGESVELCGGTHVANTQEINLFRITSEGGVAAGIRRIEAVTREAAYEAFQHDVALLHDVEVSVKTHRENVTGRVKDLVKDRSELEKQVKRLSQKLATLGAASLTADAQEIEGVKVLAKQIDATSRDQLLSYADKVRDKLGDGIVLLGAEIDGKAALLCMVTEPVFKARKVKAGDLLNAVSQHVNGRGGGRPTMAQAGGSNPAGIKDAVAQFSSVVRDALT